MGIFDSKYFKPDDELQEFLEEYEATNGRMYQGGNYDSKASYGPILPSLRPKYYGRKQSNSLRAKRNASLMTQAELATKTGTTKRTLIAIENGRRKPSVYLAIAIAEALETPVEEMFHLAPLTPVKPSKY
jgi:putative transcriptional regulator